MLKHLLAILILSAFISIAVFGVGTMSYCMLDRNAAFCHMNIFDHIASWQVIFTLFVFLPTLLFFIAAVIFSLVKDTSSQYFYLKENSNNSFFDPIKQAFSQGIIHPKIH